jgi:hypothetical protein
MRDNPAVQRPAQRRRTGREANGKGVLAVIHNDYFWLGVFATAGIVLILPTIIGLVRRAERMDLVVLLNVLTLCTGVAWFGAMAFACFMPKRLPPLAGYVTLRAGPVVPAEDMTYFVGWIE